MSAAVTTITGLSDRGNEEVLTPDALAFVGTLHERFDQERRLRLAARAAERTRLAAGGSLDFLPETAEIRAADWRVAAPPADYRDRRVEITGPTDRKLVINALNSGARGFMADFEDANVPTWSNQTEGHVNLRDAIVGTIGHRGADGQDYALRDDPATLLVRPRGLHLPERHLTVGGEAVAGAFADFALHAFHCAPELVARGRGVFFYLPKLEHHLEARLWNEVLTFTEDELGLARGTLRATVLIETLPAAFQMDEILYEMREHSLGLNAGRWDYIFSTIKCFREDPAFVTPDRSAVTMTVPFMSAYARLLVKTCHDRGAFAMGGMAALIPSRSDAKANDRALAAVRGDKEREAGIGFDGTWVAHPDVVAVAEHCFDAILGDAPNQIARKRDDAIAAQELLAVAATPGEITPQGVRGNVSVAFRYMSHWLSGRGAAAIDGLMEDAATAEICRTQLWHWVHHGHLTREDVVRLLDEEMTAIRDTVGERTWAAGRPQETRELFETVTFGSELIEFLTLPGYELLHD